MIRPAPSPKLVRLGMVTQEELDKPDSEFPTSMDYTRKRMRARHHVKKFEKRDLNKTFVLKGMETKMAY